MLESMLLLRDLLGRIPLANKSLLLFVVHDGLLYLIGTSTDRFVVHDPVECLKPVCDAIKQFS